MLSYTDQSVSYVGTRGVSGHFPDTISFQQTGRESPWFSTFYSMGMVEKGHYMGQPTTWYAPPQGPMSAILEYSHQLTKAPARATPVLREPYEDECSDHSWGQG